MDKETKKKGLFDWLRKINKVGHCPCCGGFEVEDAPDTENAGKDSQDPPKPGKNSCCG